MNPATGETTTVTLGDFYGKKVLGIALGVGWPTKSEGAKVNVYLDNLTVKGEKLLDDDTGKIEVLSKTITIDMTTYTYTAGIQDAINAALPGDIINVAAGTYNENIDIRKPLTIRGESNTNTFIVSPEETWDGWQPCINIQASDVTISRFNVTRAENGPQRGVIVTDLPESGISNIEISDMVFHDIPYEGIHVEPTNGKNISNVRIIGNEVYGYSRGIWVERQTSRRNKWRSDIGQLSP